MENSAFTKAMASMVNSFDEFSEEVKEASAKIGELYSKAQQIDHWSEYKNTTPKHTDHIHYNYTQVVHYTLTKEFDLIHYVYHYRIVAKNDGIKHQHGYAVTKEVLEYGPSNLLVETLRKGLEDCNICSKHAWIIAKELDSPGVFTKEKTYYPPADFNTYVYSDFNTTYIYQSAFDDDWGGKIPGLSGQAVKPKPSKPRPTEILRQHIASETLDSMVECPRKLPNDFCNDRSLIDMVPHLNDWHKMTFLEIADWLETLSINITIKEK